MAQFTLTPGYIEAWPDRVVAIHFEDLIVFANAQAEALCAVTRDQASAG